MRERALRTVLLVRSVEETDADGVVLPPADRAEATRATLRDAPELREAIGRPDPVPGFERFLERRATRLLDRLQSRHPALGTLARGGDRAAWLGRALLLAAFVLGLALPALDRSRLVNVLAFPLAGLVLWNLVVYVAVLASAVRGRVRVPLAARGYERWIGRRLARWVRRSEEFDAPLARAMHAFVSDWLVVARPVLAAHATRLFHLAALTVALGLIAGLYWRGLTLEYRAGWESTFLEPSGVGRLLAGIYGPASAITGIPLPRTADEIGALHWRGEQGGVIAAPWIHLIAVTAVLWIVIPRALLATVAWLRALRLRRRAALPPAAVAYARALLAGQGVTVGGRAVEPIAYAYDAPAGTDAALGRLLEAIVGSSVRVAAPVSVAYGGEDAWLARYAPASGVLAVVVCNLASTPEAENHGTLIAGVRDAVATRGRDGRAFVVVDASAYARRMGEGALAARLDERSRTWLEFARGYGVHAVVVDLARLAADEPAAAAQRVQAALATSTASPPMLARG
jgi:hypothetical protein